jgi:pyruvate dehydrogenase E1 component alpha subunit
MKGHAVHDNQAYVPKALIEEWAAKDPILRFETYLHERGLLDETKLAELKSRIEAELKDALEYAQNSPHPVPTTLLDGLYAD